MKNLFNKVKNKVRSIAVCKKAEGYVDSGVFCVED